MSTARIACAFACAAILVSAPGRALARSGCSHPSSGAEPPGPGIGGVEPSSGPSTGGTRITIKGFNLAPGAIVRIGDVEASAVELVAPGKLVAVTGPHSPGRVAVSVTNPDGRTGSRSWSYRYVAAQ